MLVFLAWKAPASMGFLKYLTRYGLLHKDSHFNKWSMIGSAFSHIAFWHVAINMFVLYQMGIPVARMIGTGDFLACYMNGAVVSSLFSIMSPVLTGYRSLAPSLGASGSIFTMFGLFTWLVPNVRIAYFFIPLPMSGWMVFLSSIGINVAGMFYRWGRIDYAGHVGGSIVALVYGNYMSKKLEERRRRQRQYGWVR
jgi:rhomboid-like protein